MFKVTVAGREAWAILDTGADISVIDSGFAQESKLNIDTPGGSLGTYHAAVSALRVVREVPFVVPGQFEAHPATLAVMDLKSASNALGHKIDFILGNEFLAIMYVMIDPSTKTVQFGPSGSLNPRSSIPFIELRNGKPHVDALINGQKVVLAVDTGSEFAVTLTPTAWEKMGLSVAKNAQKAGVDGRGLEVSVGQIDSLVVGTARAQNVKVPITQGLAGSTVDGVLGNGFLDGQMFVLDQKLGKMWVLPPKKPATAQ